VVRKGWLGCSKKLIEHSRTRRSINATDHKGKTPLHRATAYGHNLVVNVLFQKGATVLRQVCMIYDATHICSCHLFLHLCFDWLSCNCWLWLHRDSKGMTPLHYAAVSGDAVSCKLVLTADIHCLNDKDKDGVCMMVHKATNNVTACYVRFAIEYCITFSCKNELSRCDSAFARQGSRVQYE
jgi:ankyrin repeat protein